MTDKDKLFWADFMIFNCWDGKYIAGIPLRLCNKGDMCAITDDGLPMPHEGKKVLVFHNPDNGLEVNAYEWVKAENPEDGYVLSKIDWVPTDEEIVAAMKDLDEGGPVVKMGDKRVQKFLKMRWGEDFN